MALEVYGALSTRIVTFENTTRQSPAELNIPLEANSLYEFEYCLVYNQEYTYNANLNTWLKYSGELDFYALMAETKWTSGVPGINTTSYTGLMGQNAASLYAINFVGTNNLGGGLNAGLRGSIFVRGQIRTSTAGNMQVEYLRSSNSNLGNYVWMCEGTYLMARKMCNTKANSQLFTANGTFTKPPGATTVIVYAVGGGGGGGSGRVGSRASTYNGGGHGGGGGGYSLKPFAVADLTETVAVTVGLGGAGGARVGPSTGVLAGNIGAAGGASSFGAYLTAGGGAGGNQGFEGNTSSSNISTGGTGTTSSGGGGWAVNPSGGTATVNSSENGSAALGPGGGGGGGGGTYIGGVLISNGSRGGNAPTDLIPAGGIGGASGGASAATGGVPSNVTPEYPAGVNPAGAGGGGGGCWYPIVAGTNPTGPSGDGGDGGSFGAGGGGGGAGVSYGTGFPGTGGKGGNGANGCVFVVWY